MNENTMATARGLFGTNFGIRMHNIPPRKGFPRKVLEVGNIMNLVKLSEPELDLGGRQKIKEFNSGQRIDLVYDEGIRVLSIQITYSDEKAESPIISNILGFPMIDAIPNPNIPARRERRIKQVPTQTVFLYNDKFFTVTNSDGSQVHAFCDDDGEQVVLENDFLWNLILEC
jgi:hypothetical protein